jgi:hypothetical protein
MLLLKKKKLIQTEGCGLVNVDFPVGRNSLLLGLYDIFSLSLTLASLLLGFEFFRELFEKKLDADAGLNSKGLGRSPSVICNKIIVSYIFFKIIIIIKTNHIFGEFIESSIFSFS